MDVGLNSAEIIERAVVVYPGPMLHDGPCHQGLLPLFECLRSLTFVSERLGVPTTLPASYLEDGHVEHAYAMTIHKAQGATYDRCLLYGDDGIYRQAAYTALSRGRSGNALYGARDETDPLDTHAAEVGHAPEPGDAEWSDTAGLLRRLRSDRSQHLAIDSVPTTDRQRATEMRHRLRQLDRAPQVDRDLGPEIPFP